MLRTLLEQLFEWRPDMGLITYKKIIIIIYYLVNTLKCAE